MKLRLDEILVNKKIAKTRSQARLLIQDGKIFVNGEVVKKAGKSFNEGAEVEAKERQKYVGRGSKKMEAAITRFKISPEGKTVADVGASTGGFTDYLLQHGATKVYAIDVGHNQLAEKLRHDNRVINMEGQNIRDLNELPEKADMAVVDLSYISLRLAMKNITKITKKGGDIICLIKPQFEAGEGVVGKNGIIKDDKTREKILEEFLDWCKAQNYKIIRTITSPITGKDGNIEYLAHIVYTAPIS